MLDFIFDHAYITLARTVFSNLEFIFQGLNLSSQGTITAITQGVSSHTSGLPFLYTSIRRISGTRKYTITPDVGDFRSVLLRILNAWSLNASTHLTV